MIINVKFYLLILGTIFIFVHGCKSTQTKIQKEDSADNKETVVVEPNNEEKNPDKEIVVIINERVKYIFIKIDDKWRGQVTQFDSNDPETRKVVKVFKVQPQLGWEDFENMVEFLNINTLPDQSKIENRKAGQLTPQSRSYKITAFDGDSTRTYSYFNPEGEAANHWQSQQISTFGSYIATEMKVVETVNN